MLTMIIGGSSVGKSSLMREIDKLANGKVGIPTTYTNRKKREGEDKVSYRFVSDEEMDELLKSGLVIVDQAINTYIENDAPKMTYWVLNKAHIKATLDTTKDMYIKDSCYDAYKSIINTDGFTKYADNILLVYLYCKDEEELNRRYNRRFKGNGGRKEKERRMKFDKEQHEIFINDLSDGKIPSYTISINTSKKNRSVADNARLVYEEMLKYLD